MAAGHFLGPRRRSVSKSRALQCAGAGVRVLPPTLLPHVSHSMNSAREQERYLERNSEAVLPQTAERSRSGGPSARSTLLQASGPNLGPCVPASVGSAARFRGSVRLAAVLSDVPVPPVCPSVRILIPGSGLQHRGLGRCVSGPPQTSIGQMLS
ncbi:hypothetical protein NDU88_000756 [Pleurodeles waltl]|uniref:Uncharacterized protein n=1 Tax=Pleurodeles waltl TaxID=8319 RepID=A0AAV7VXU9_PLEWA|nr:hypothetical protein NDU88_000756 [Pleurodeles waltl]